jgi:hypothetical protein
VEFGRPIIDIIVLVIGCALCLHAPGQGTSTHTTSKVFLSVDIFYVLRDKQAVVTAWTITESAASVSTGQRR